MNKMAAAMKLLVPGLLVLVLPACEQERDAAQQPVMETGREVQERQPDYVNQDIRVEELAKNLYVIYGTGPNSNVGLFTGEEGALLIDTQLETMSDTLLAVIRNITDAPIRYIINTHIHLDHVQGNARFRTDNVAIIAHRNVHHRLSRAESDIPSSVLPVMTYDDTATVYLNGEEISISWPGPAHTDGDSVIYFHNANVVFTGDLFFKHRFPFIDRVNGGSLAGLIQNADTLINRTDDSTVFVPGHHQPGGRADLIMFRDMLLRTRDETVELIEQGKTVDEIIATGPFADLYEGWQTPFMPAERYIRILFQELQE